MATPTLTKKRALLLEMKVQQLVNEVQELRREFFLSSLPEEEVEGYAHPKRIRRDLREALKEYPLR